MKPNLVLCLWLGTLLFAQDAEVSPPVTEIDLHIVRRAHQILSSPAKWNRVDTRVCPPNQKTYSLYCALESATEEISGKFQHRGAAMQQARFVIDTVLAKGNHYKHRLMDYNNDPRTKFADVERLFAALEKRIKEELSAADNVHQL